MSLLTQLGGLLTGGLPKVIEGVVGKYLPPSMSEAEKQAMSAEIAAASRAHEIEILRIAGEAEVEFNQRIKDIEGTAKDLKALPIIGNVIIFLRGSFRPLFSYGVLFWDWKMFSGGWPMQDREIILAINLLVLGFFFGERAVKNLMPFFERWQKARNGNGQ